MSQPREPQRWADAASGSDPSLRRLLQSARQELADPGLAERIERAVLSHAEPAFSTKPTAHTWRPWVGMATLLLGLTGALIASRSSNTDTSAAAGSSHSKNPAAGSVTKDISPAARSQAPAAASANTNTSPSARSQALAAASVNTNDSLAAASSTTIMERDAAKQRRARGSEASRNANAANTSARRTTPLGNRTTLGGDPSFAAAAGTWTDKLRTEASHATPSSVASEASSASALSAAEPADAHSSTELGTTVAADSPRAPAPAKRSVAPELSLISAAQRALRTTPSEALALAQEHKSAYPNGRFSEEREEIAISALWALGDQASARARAQSFLAQHPRALSAPRIARLLDTAR